MLSAIVGVTAPLIAPIIGSTIAGFVAWGVHLLFKRMTAKVEDEHLTNLLGTMDAMAGIAVNSVEQTVVAELIKQKQWGTPAAYGTALQAGIDALKVLAVAQLPELAKVGVTDLNQYLAHLIEGKIKVLNTERDARSIAVPVPLGTVK